MSRNTWNYNELVNHAYSHNGKIYIHSKFIAFIIARKSMKLYDAYIMIDQQ
jgi:hypothetical protein